ncbi:MAG: hypothetical protein AzoDbin1_01211 [Azoarcus sp.]|uniref:Cytochrome P460 n=1 Tax=Aromatoleum tolulyticum TaxID=34027 RepID=A0A1N6SPX8_9RHOO|nr:hypothetical protein [Aromatoleum tolulyticum]MCK9984739.1 hypothetical protein [Azoarcus sp.]SIQ43101.1 hypothetical protein SAMN05421829_104173 [Aromatoleum tolulyticum]
MKTTLPVSPTSRAQAPGAPQAKRNRFGSIGAASLLACAIGFTPALHAKEIAVGDGSFKCLNDMVKVRHFYVDNLLGNRAATIKVAERGKGKYPPGSVVQLIPGEVMVKHPDGFNPATRDWEFFELDVSKDGSRIRRRGFVDVVNRFGGNCFACHAKARPEFDMVCEIDHGCDPIPITRRMLAALQKTDPRCSAPAALADDDRLALKELDEVLKTMTMPAGPK